MHFRPRYCLCHVTAVLALTICLSRSVYADTAAWSNDFERIVPDECIIRAWVDGVNTPYTYGWDVRFNVSARITALGIYDAGYSPYELPDPNNPKNVGVGVPGITVDTPVGLWNATGDLLAQTVVPAGESAELIDRIRYMPISPVDVAAGDILTVGRFATGDWSTTGDFESWPNLALADYYYTDCWFRMSGDITHVGGRWGASSSLTYPSNLDSTTPYQLVGSATFLYQLEDLIFADGFE